MHGRGTDAGGSPVAMRGVPNHPRGTHAATNEPHRSDGHEILHLRRGGDDSILAALRRRECGFNAGCAKPVGACSADDDAQGTVPHRPVHHLQHSPSCFVDDIAGRGTWVSRLALESTLEGHDGCVNTVTWHPNGKWAVSGSDDTMVGHCCEVGCALVRHGRVCTPHWLPQAQIKVWQPHAPASKRLLYSIPSGHTGNIFRYGIRASTGAMEAPPAHAHSRQALWRRVAWPAPSFWTARRGAALQAALPMVKCAGRSSRMVVAARRPSTATTAWCTHWPVTPAPPRYAAGHSRACVRVPPSIHAVPALHRCSCRAARTAQ